MTLEQSVCAREYSERLKELGVKQESLFYWERTVGQTDDNLWRLVPRDRCQFYDKYLDYVAAPTVSELGEMLPSRISSYRLGLAYACEGGESSGCLPDYKVLVRDTEADSRAAMLIYLIEQGIIKV